MGLARPTIVGPGLCRALVQSARLVGRLACDAGGGAGLRRGAVRESAFAEHARYGEAILNMAESLVAARSIPSAVGFLVREPALSGRIRAIASYRGPSRLWTPGGSILLAALVLAGLTDALQNTGRAQADAGSRDREESHAAPLPGLPSEVRGEIQNRPEGAGDD